jgi:hypothetical protein
MAASVAGQATAADTHQLPLQQLPSHHPAAPVQPQKNAHSATSFKCQVASQYDATSALSRGKRTQSPTS